LHIYSVTYTTDDQRCFTNSEPVMWSETVGLRTRPVWDQKIGLVSCGIGLGLGLAVLVLFCKTRSCNARRHNDLEGHSKF